MSPERANQIIAETQDGLRVPGDAIDSACDCGKGDYCPQFGRTFLASDLHAAGRRAGVTFTLAQTDSLVDLRRRIEFWTDADLRGIEPPYGS